MTNAMEVNSSRHKFYFFLDPTHHIIQNLSLVQRKLTNQSTQWIGFRIQEKGEVAKEH